MGRSRPRPPPPRHLPRRWRRCARTARARRLPAQTRRTGPARGAAAGRGGAGAAPPPSSAASAPPREAGADPPPLQTHSQRKQ
eukprot:6203448-Pleurochrysis_carterae.AAC.2